MNKLQGSTIGILMFIFGIVMTYVLFDMGFLQFTDSGFYGLLNSTLLRIIWLAGLLMVWSLAIIVVPYLFISGNSNIKVWNTYKGVLIFLVASFICYLSYNIIPPILGFLDGITGFGDLGIVSSLGWFVLIIFWVISLILYPIAIILKGGIKSKDDE